MGIDRAMTEYIDREQALKQQIRVTEYDEGGWANTIYAVPVDVLRKLPAVDVEKVRHGHWIYHRAPNSIADDYIECSLCGRYVYENAQYCPECGARCDGEMVYHGERRKKNDT